MKHLRIVCLIILAVFISDSAFSQRKARQRGKTVVVVRHSRYRPRHVSVFRPHWHQRLTCQRRWVYFPRHNFYWDNWRNRYLYFNGAIWVSKSTAPATVSNVVLADETFYELNETDDDNDDIALANKEHQEKYKKN
jgi:hypothetical protein